MDEGQVIGAVDNRTWTRLSKQDQDFPCYHVLSHTHLANNGLSVGMGTHREVERKMTAQ